MEGLVEQVVQVAPAVQVVQVVQAVQVVRRAGPGKAVGCLVHKKVAVVHKDIADYREAAVQMDSADHREAVVRMDTADRKVMVVRTVAVHIVAVRKAVFVRKVGKVGKVAWVEDG